MGEVGLGSDPVDDGSGLSTDHIKGLRMEAGVDQSHLGGGSAAHVEDGVAHQQVALLHQVFVQDLLGDQEAGTGLVLRQAGAKYRAQGAQSQQVLEHSKIAADYEVRISRFTFLLTWKGRRKMRLSAEGRTLFHCIYPSLRTQRRG